MVFFAPAQSAHREHVAPSMVAPLFLLAGGVLFAWLLAEPFAGWLQQTMPYHAAYLLPELPVADIISTHTVLAVSTLIVLSLTVVGLLLGWRAAGRPVVTDSQYARGVGRLESVFNEAAGGVAGLTQGAATQLQKTQTGQLNLNVAAIVVGLIALLILILQGVL